MASPLLPSSIPGSRKTWRLLVMFAVLLSASALTAWIATDSNDLPTSLLATKTRADCFEEQRTGRMTPECRTILFGSFATATPVAVATSDPNGPTPTPKQPVGARCLNDGQCATGNCVMGSGNPAEPTLLIGTCGCRERPACLDADPPCMIAETDDMCVCGNRQCERGEKTSCPRDCASPSPTAEPTCTSCRSEGFAYLCQGGFTGGKFCGNDPGGAGADYTCTKCDEPPRCVPEGQECRTDADCGSCGATCSGDGMTASEPPSIINGKCSYPASCLALDQVCTRDGECCSGWCAVDPASSADVRRCVVKPSASPIIMCEYAPPPEGCTYVAGPNFNQETNCGLELSCSTPSGSPIAMCDYAAPPQGCSYVPGPNFDRETNCGLELRCEVPSPEPTEGITCPADLKDCGNGIMVGRVLPDCQFPATCPASRSFRLVVPTPLVVGDTADLSLCVTDQDGQIDPSYRGWATVRIAAGPTAEQDTFLTADMVAADQGCRVFPAVIRPVRSGILKLEALDLHFADIGDTDPTIRAGIEVPVSSLPSASPRATPTIGACPLQRGDLTCDGRVDVADLALLRDILTGVTTLPSVSGARSNGDLNGNNVLDLADLAWLADFLTGRLSTL